MANARERIEKLISENPVVLFMKGTPEFPQCGFSGQVIQILEYVGAPVVGVNVLEDADIRQGVKEYANWPTIPQLYVKGEFVGGCDIVREMFQSGELVVSFDRCRRSVESQRRGLRRSKSTSPLKARSGGWRRRMDDHARSPEGPWGRSRGLALHDLTRCTAFGPTTTLAIKAQ